MLNVKPRLGLDWGQIFELGIHHPKNVALSKIHHNHDGSPFIGVKLSSGTDPADQEVTRYYSHSEIEVLEREIALLQEGLDWLRGQLRPREMTPPAHAHHHLVAEAERVFSVEQPRSNETFVYVPGATPPADGGAR